MANNALLYNAAYVAAINGFTVNRNLSAAVASGTTFETDVIAAATSCATQVDALIPNNYSGSASPDYAVDPAGPISVVTTGVAIAPTTGTLTNAQINKCALLAGIVSAQMTSQSPVRNPVGSPATTTVPAAVCAAIADLYLKAIPTLIAG